MGISQARLVLSSKAWWTAEVTIKASSVVRHKKDREMGGCHDNDISEETLVLHKGAISTCTVGWIQTMGSLQAKTNLGDVVLALVLLVF